MQNLECISKKPVKIAFWTGNEENMEQPTETDFVSPGYCPKWNIFVWMEDGIAGWDSIGSFTETISHEFSCSKECLNIHPECRKLT